MSNWKVIAHLSSPLCGDAPYIDTLLEHEMAQRQGKAMRLRRSDPAPPVGNVHIPCLRGEFGGLRGIPRCSAPIIEQMHKSNHEYFAKRISVENASMLRDDQRLVVATGNSWTKSYRLPLRVQRAHRVAWFVTGSKRRNLKSLLDSVHAIGQDAAKGYGRVARWEIVEYEHDHAWFAPTDRGTLLMRALPLCDELPADLIGYRRWYGACVGPMWHPDRFMEIVQPC